MDSIPSTRYTQAADGTHLAYQVFGDGSRDLVIVWGGMSHIELMWDDPTLAGIFRRLASFARVVQFDRRGTGMSDRPRRASTAEERMEDIAAVMDAAGCASAAILGESEAAPLCCLFAATHPDRATSLVLYGPQIRMVGDETFPWAQAPEAFEAALERGEHHWGDEDLIWAWAPSRGADPAARRFFSPA